MQTIKKEYIQKIYDSHFFEASYDLKHVLLSIKSYKLWQTIFFVHS
jgi:hypothetical protein